MRNCTRGLAILVAATGLCSFAAVSADATDDDEGRRARLSAKLDGFQEVPAVVTDGHGNFSAELLESDEDGTVIEYALSYSDLDGAVLQAHIHVGQRGTTGGVAVFLCTTLGNGPEGTQECPPAPAEISGTITADDVIGPIGQGIGPGDLDDLIDAMASRATYVNVHSDVFEGGEIRGQIRLLRRGRGQGKGRGPGFGHGRGHAFGHGRGRGQGKRWR